MTRELTNATDLFAVQSALGIGVNAFSRMKGLLARGKPVEVLVVSDSLGNDSFEFVRVFCNHLTAAYPASPVTYYRVSQTSPNTSWETAVTVQVGSTGPAITVRNFAIGGTRPDFSLGARRAFALETAAPDVIVLCHGGNNFVGNPDACIRGEFWSWLMEVDYIHPGIPIVAIREPPFREDNVDTVAHDANLIPSWDRVMAHCPNVTIADAWGRFMAATPDRSPTSPLYSDDIHLSAEGQALSLTPAVVDLFDAAAIGGSLPPLGLASRRGNLIHGGDLASWSGGIPVSDNGLFTAQGSAVVTQVAAPSDRRGQHATVASAGAAGAALRWAINSTYLPMIRGRRVTLAVRLKVPTGNISTSGRIALAAGSTLLGTQTVSHRASLEPQGDWVYKVIAGFEVPPDASYLYASVYADSATSTGQVVSLDSMVLSMGDIPHGA
jgi:lysophospholipase L1-like esterase